MSTEKRDLEDNPWFIGGIIVLVFALVGGMGYFFHQSDLKSEARDRSYQEELAKRPIKDLRNGFIQVDEMNCRPALKGWSKRQLSELTDEERWIAKDATECGVVFEHVRIKKDRVRSYHPHYSILLWRNDDVEDPNGPLHVKKVNIEDCEIGVGPTSGKINWVVVAGECKYMDWAL